MRKHLYTLVLCAILSPVTAAWAQVPTPSIAPKSWQLRFRYQDPQRVSVFVPGKAEPVLYWYMLYPFHRLIFTDMIEAIGGQAVQSEQ